MGKARNLGLPEDVLAGFATPLALLARALDDRAAVSGADLTALAAYLLMLFYAPCAEPSAGWPCAQTPAFLGVAPLPRALHDGAVNARFLAPILIWVACLIRLLPAENRQARGIEPSRKRAAAL